MSAHATVHGGFLPILGEPASRERGILAAATAWPSGSTLKIAHNGHLRGGLQGGLGGQVLFPPLPPQKRERRWARKTYP